MGDDKILPEEIYEKREQLGLEHSMDLLVDVLENAKELEDRKKAIMYLGLTSQNAAGKKKECQEILESIIISEENLELKCEAALALGKLGHKESLKPLRWILEDEHASKSNELILSALKSIPNIRFDEKEIQLFINYLVHAYPPIKEFVKNQLLALTPDELINNLLTALKKEEFSEKQKIAIVNLIGFELASLNVSYEDASFLKIKYSDLINALCEHETLLLETIVPNLKLNDAEMMNNVLSILRLFGNEIHDKLIDFLSYDDFLIRKNAIKLLGELEVDKAVEPLLNHLDDIYDEVSLATIDALGNIGNISAVSHLLKVLDIEDVNYEYIDLDFKFFILDAIKKIYLKSEKQDFEILYAILKKDNDILKESVAYLLGEIGREEFLNPLLDLLKEKNFDVRKNAIIALGKIGNKNAIEPLLSIINDNRSYWLLKKVAVDAIFNIFLKHLYINEAKRMHFEREFIAWTERLIDALKLEDDENFKVKLAIIKFLEVFGGKSALNPLLREIDNFYRVVSIAATKAIKKIEKRLELEGQSKNN
ncbi:MAG: HEAT repeat domain-containing protein [Promethearchaeota archaeon]